MELFAPESTPAPGTSVRLDDAGDVAGISAMAQPQAPTALTQPVQEMPIPQQMPEGGIVPTNPEAAADAQAFAGPASPADYLFARVPQALPEGLHYDINREIGWRNFLHAEGVPAPIGKELSRLALEGMLAKPQNDEQLAVGRQKAYAQLERMWGPDTDARLAAVNGELTRMESAKPGLKAYLARTGLANSAWLAVTIYNVSAAKGRIK